VGTKAVVENTGILKDVGDITLLSTTDKSSIVNAVNEVKGNFLNITTAQVAEDPSYLYFTTARARQSVSVTDTGGDGSLAYDNVSGVLTYTGPSASEVRAHFSGGTGVTITDGVVAIGQAVGTTDNVTFNDTTLTGVLYGPAQFVIDPATFGDASGEVIILGDLTVQGTTTTVNSTTVEIEDKNLLLAKSAINSTQADGGGISLAGAGANISYNAVTDSWNPNKTLKGVAGEAVSPTYSFATDADSGLYSSGANSVSIATNGIERFRVISGGNTTLFGGNLIFDRAGFATTLGLIAPTANRVLNLPNVDGTLATTADLSQFAPTTSAQLAGIITDETGTGALVFATSPSLTTPSLGAATATSINKVAITAPATSATLTIADGKTLTVSNTLTFTGTDTSSVAFGTGGTVAYTASNNPFTGANTFTNSTGQIFRQAATQDGVLLRGRAGGTSSHTVEIVPSTLSASRTVTLADGDTTLQAGTMAVTGSTLAQFAATTSLQLAGVISDETGTGALVFATSPSLTTPAIGAATGTSLALTGGGLTTRPAATQDAVVVSGRAGGTGSFAVTIIPTTLTASRTLTAPNVSGTIVTTGDTGTVTSTMIADGTIVDADVNASAAIAHSKLAAINSAQVLLGNASNVPTATTVTGDVTISNTGVTSISNGVIVDSDISATAEIAVSKLADGASRQLLQTDAAGTGVEWTDNVDVPGTLDVTGNAVFDARVTVNGIDITESARDIEESRLIRRNATVSIGTPGTVPFGVGPIIPPGMSLVGIGPDAYNVIDIYSGSVC
jgi:hypothetical protein